MSKTTDSRASSSTISSHHSTSLMTNHSLADTGNMAGSVDGGLCMSMGTDLTRNLLLNRMTDLSWDWMTHFPGNRPGHGDLDGVAGDVCGGSGGGDTAGLDAGDTDLLWDICLLYTSPSPRD